MGKATAVQAAERRLHQRRVGGSASVGRVQARLQAAGCLRVVVQLGDPRRAETLAQRWGSQTWGMLSLDSEVPLS